MVLVRGGVRFGTYNIAWSRPWVVLEHIYFYGSARLLRGSAAFKHDQSISAKPRRGVENAIQQDAWAKISAAVALHTAGELVFLASRRWNRQRRVTWSLYYGDLCSVYHCLGSTAFARSLFMAWSVIAITAREGQVWIGLNLHLPRHFIYEYQFRKNTKAGAVYHRHPAQQIARNVFWFQELVILGIVWRYSP